MLKKFALLSAIVAAAATVAANAGEAHAKLDRRAEWSVKSVRDSRDGGMLDFRYVRIIQSQSCAEFAFGIWTWSAWSNKILPTFNTSIPSLLVGPNRFTMLLDVNGDRKPDFVGDIVRPGVMELIDERRREIFDEPLGMERPTAFHA